MIFNISTLPECEVVSKKDLEPGILLITQFGLVSRCPRGYDFLPPHLTFNQLLTGRINVLFLVLSKIANPSYFNY
jgi:hypothetical protein